MKFSIENVFSFRAPLWPQKNRVWNWNFQSRMKFSNQEWKFQARMKILCVGDFFFVFMRSSENVFVFFFFFRSTGSVGKISFFSIFAPLGFRRRKRGRCGWLALRWLSLGAVQWDSSKPNLLGLVAFGANPPWVDRSLKNDHQYRAEIRCTLRIF